MDFDNLKAWKFSAPRIDAIAKPTSEKLVTPKRVSEGHDSFSSGLASATTSKSLTASLPSPDASRLKKRRTDAGRESPAVSAEAASPLGAKYSRYQEIFDSVEIVPGFAQSLDQLRKVVCQRGLPFVFAISQKTGLDGSKFERAFPWAGAYFEAKPIKIEEEGDNVTLHYVLDGDVDVYNLGKLDKISESSHPLMGYIIRTNDSILDTNPQRRMEIYKAAAVGYLAFEIGISVKKDSKVANSFLATIPIEERKSVYSCIMVEALGNQNLNLAMHCLSLSNGLASCDDDGHTALMSALYPKAETFLKRLIANTPESELRYLANAKKYADFAKWPRASALLEKRAGDLGYTLEEGSD